MRSTSSTTTVNAPDVVTSTVDFEDSHTDDEAVACDISCEENVANSSNGTCVVGPVFRPFLLGTGYCQGLWERCPLFCFAILTIRRDRLFPFLRD